MKHSYFTKKNNLTKKIDIDPVYLAFEYFRDINKNFKN